MIEIVVSRDFAASPEAVFDSWLAPEKARRFLFATAHGEVTRCDIDPRVGGGFTIVDRRGDTDAVHRGRYELIDRPRRLVFLFSPDAEGDDDWSRVSIDILPRDSGCTLTLRHEMDERWADYEPQTRQGWTAIVEGLGRSLEPAKPEPSAAMQVRPFLMFQGEGVADAAIGLYTSLLAGSRVEALERYGPGEQGAEGSVKQAVISLAGQTVICMDSPITHAFDFTPSFSFFVDVASGDEFERLIAGLGESGEFLMAPDDYGFSRRFAWLNDRFGVSWQVNLP